LSLFTFSLISVSNFITVIIIIIAFVSENLAHITTTLIFNGQFPG